MMTWEHLGTAVLAATIMLAIWFVCGELLALVVPA